MEPKTLEVFEDGYGDFSKFEDFAASAAKEFELFRSSDGREFDDDFAAVKKEAHQAEATKKAFTTVETTTQTVDSSTRHSNSTLWPFQAK